MAWPLRERGRCAVVGEGWAEIWVDSYLCAILVLQGCEGTGYHERGKWHRCLCSLQEKKGKCSRCEYKGDRWGRIPPPPPPNLTWVPEWVLPIYLLIRDQG